MADFHAYANFDVEMGKMAKGFLVRKAHLAAWASWHHVGVDINGPHPGLLRSTIRADKRARKAMGSPGKYDVHVRAGSKRAFYALAHHQGFSAYDIEGDRVMKFPYQGRMVYTKKIHHGGFAGNPYLVQGARDALADTGARVIHFRNVTNI